MFVAAVVFAVIAALLHVLFFSFESLLWARPRVYKRFGVSNDQDATTIRPMAYNQGFYNLALAIGVVVGVILFAQSGEVAVAGRALILFGAGTMAFAGVILATTGRSYLRAAAIQFVPAALAVVFTALV